MPSINDFTRVDFSSTNPADIVNNNLPTSQSSVAFDNADATTPAGIWYVGGDEVSAGNLVMSKFYVGFINVESTIATHMAAMNTNTMFSQAASNFSNAVRAKADTVALGTALSYADLITLATPHVAGLGITAAQFVAQTLPSELNTATYTGEQLRALCGTIDQYASSKLTDNSVLQQKLDTAMSQRNTIVDALAGLLKSWYEFLTTVSRGVA